MTSQQLVEAIMIGIGATMCIDVWATLAKRVFGIRSLDYCLLGRWLLHMPAGRFHHEDIASSESKRGECGVGWTAHYTIGVAFAIVFVLLAPAGWMERPTLVPALVFGVATVVVPFFTLQPGMGLGIASSKTARPHLARLRSLTTHAIFGTGLHVCARLVSAAS